MTGDLDGAREAWKTCMSLARAECTDAAEEHYLRKHFTAVLDAGITMREAAPGYDEGWYYEGSALFYLDRDKEAVAPLFRAATLDSEDFLNHYMHGYALIYAGSPDKALDALDKAAKLAPDDPDIYDVMAKAHEALGNTKQRDAMQAKADSLRD
jgi:predicted Zn-dependent protease